MPLPTTDFIIDERYTKLISKEHEKRVYHEAETETHNAVNYVAIFKKSAEAVSARAAALGASTDINELDVAATVYWSYRLYSHGQQATNSQRMWMGAYVDKSGNMLADFTTGSPENAFEYQLEWLLEKTQDEPEIVIDILKEARKYERYSSHGSSSRYQFFPLLEDDFFIDRTYAKPIEILGVLSS